MSGKREFGKTNTQEIHTEQPKIWKQVTKILKSRNRKTKRWKLEIEYECKGNKHQTIVDLKFETYNY